jgi:hypothetical protein
LRPNLMNKILIYYSMNPRCQRKILPNNGFGKKQS